MAVLLVSPYMYFTDDNGNPLAGGKVYTYLAGTTTPKATFTDQSGDTPNTNPIILDASGRAAIWGSGSYKIKLTDAAGTPIGPNGGVTDNVQSFTTISGAASTFFQQFSGDGSNKTFTLSQNMGTDPNVLDIFIDRSLRQFLVNRTFTSSASWTLGAAWTISGGVANATTSSAAISQTAALTLLQGQMYIVSYTITRSAGTLTCSIGGTNGTAQSASGTFTETIICGSTQTIAWTGAGFTGTLSNVSVTKVQSNGNEYIPPTKYTLSGDQLVFTGDAPENGINNISVKSVNTAGPAAAAAADASASAAAAANSATSAAASATTATTQATSATSSATAASNSATSAANSSALALQYAQGTPTEPSGGSAKTWAEAASAIAIPAESIDNSKLANMTNSTVKGRNSAGTGVPEDVTMSQLFTLLGLGTAATANTGTGANNIVQLDASAKLPAVDGSQLTNLPSTGTSIIDDQTFTASGTWTKPAGALGTDTARIRLWGGGGGGANGSNGGGGGGGGFVEHWVVVSTLGSTETFVVGAGGGVNATGGFSSFGTTPFVWAGGGGGAYYSTPFKGGGGGAGSIISSSCNGGNVYDSPINTGGGGAGIAGNGSTGATGTGGAPSGGSGTLKNVISGGNIYSSPQCSVLGGGGASGYPVDTGSNSGATAASSVFGGGGGAGGAAAVGASGGSSVYGGGGGGGGVNTTTKDGGSSIWGGGGGAGYYSSTATLGGLSTHGGNGGNYNTAGTAPAGGGGFGQSGARGQVQVTIFRGVVYQKQWGSM